ncbi:MAG: 50S ribosomal protein L27 [Firmicutes bacterium]|nr:50S ribosomal protein L27 [Bacillota bacterium]
MIKLYVKLNIQRFAHKKGQSSTDNGRDSAGRRLGAKLADGQKAQAGAIIYRQRGTKIYPGKNVGMGKDHTLFSLINGVVKYERSGKNRKKVSVYENI